MKMKGLFFVLVAFCFVFFVSCVRKPIVKDSHYYFLGNKTEPEKISLKVSTRFIVIQPNAGVDNQELARDLEKKYAHDWPRFKAFSFGGATTAFVFGTDEGVLSHKDWDKLVRSIRQNPNVRYAGPIYHLIINGEVDYKQLLVPLDDFFAQFIDGTTERQVFIINKRHGTVVKKMWSEERKIYFLRVINPNKSNALEMANIYTFLPEIEWAEPNFITIQSR